MTRLKIAKSIIKEYVNKFDVDCGIFDNWNTAGDPMIRVYDNDGLVIQFCYHWQYFEVFGLSKSEFADLKEYYLALIGKRL